MCGLTAGAVKGDRSLETPRWSAAAVLRGTVPATRVGGLLEEGLGGICLFGSNLTGVRTSRGADDGRACRGPGRARSPSTRRAATSAACTGHWEPGSATRARARRRPALTRRRPADIGWQLRAAGITVDLAPSVDVNSNAANPVIGTRSFGSDPSWWPARRVGARPARRRHGRLREALSRARRHHPGQPPTLPVLKASEDVLRSRDAAAVRGRRRGRRGCGDDVAHRGAGARRGPPRDLQPPVPACCARARLRRSDRQRRPRHGRRVRRSRDPHGRRTRAVRRRRPAVRRSRQGRGAGPRDPGRHRWCGPVGSSRPRSGWTRRPRASTDPAVRRGRSLARPLGRRPRSNDRR